MIMVPSAPKGANIQVGDYVSRVGIYTNPAVVIEKNTDGSLILDTDKEALQKYHRHSLTTGLTPEDKDKFNEIMDKVQDIKDNPERILTLQKNIDMLRKDPATRKVSDYLKNEQAQLIRLSKELPRVYEAQPEKLR